MEIGGVMNKLDTSVEIDKITKIKQIDGVIMIDEEGPIERLEDWNYDSADICALEAEKLAIAYNIRFCS